MPVAVDNPLDFRQEWEAGRRQRQQRKLFPPGYVARDSLLPGG
jgi:hypothetical protein